MSLLGGLFGGGTKKHTQTQTSQFPAEVEDLQKYLTGGVREGMTPYIENPTPYVSPRTDYQDWMRRTSHNLLEDMLSRNYGGIAEGMIGRTSDVGPDYSSYAMDTYGLGEAAMPVAAHIPKLTYDSVAEFSNPFREEMTDMAIRRIDENHKKRAAGTAARAARGSAFKGSGEAIGHFLNDKNAGQEARDAATQIAYDSYGQGLNAATTNANLESAGADRFINTLFGSAKNDQNAASLADGLTTSVFNRGRGSFQDDMNATMAAETLGGSYMDRIMAGISGVNAEEAAYRTDDQRVGDIPWTGFSRMAGFVPGYVPSTSSTQPVYSNPLSTGLGALGLASSLWG